MQSMDQFWQQAENSSRMAHELHTSPINFPSFKNRIFFLERTGPECAIIVIYDERI